MGNLFETFDTYMCRRNGSQSNFSHLPMGEFSGWVHGKGISLANNLTALLNKKTKRSRIQLAYLSGKAPPGIYTWFATGKDKDSVNLKKFFKDLVLPILPGESKAKEFRPDRALLIVTPKDKTFILLDDKVIFDNQSAGGAGVHSQIALYRAAVSLLQKRYPNLRVNWRYDVALTYSDTKQQIIKNMCLDKEINSDNLGSGPEIMLELGIEDHEAFIQDFRDQSTAVKRMIAEEASRQSTILLQENQV